MRLPATVLAAAALLAGAAPAAATDPSITDGSALAELREARQRWDMAGLTDYRYRLRVLCFCTEDQTRPRTMRVRNGKPVKPGELHRAYSTVPRLFKVIGKAIADEVDGLTVDYGRRGLPRKVFIDQTEMAVDEELTLRASRLRRLK